MRRDFISRILSTARISRPQMKLLLKSQNLTWTQSVPPRGSGWVRSLFGSQRVYDVPTRYREVVLTVSNKDR